MSNQQIQRFSIGGFVRIGAVAGVLALATYASQSYLNREVAAPAAPVAVAQAPEVQPTAVAQPVEPSQRGEGMPVGDGKDADRESFYTLQEQTYTDGHATCVYGGLTLTTLDDCKRNTELFKAHYIAAFGEAAYAQR